MGETLGEKLAPGRKRKWDQPAADANQRSPENLVSDPAAAAIAAAAQISASVSATVSSTPRIGDGTSTSAGNRAHVGGILDTPERPSRELEINDRPNRRHAISSIKSIEAKCGASIVTRGVFYPPDADPPPPLCTPDTPQDKRKLYLLVTAATMASVEAAIDMLEVCMSDRQHSGQGQCGPHSSWTGFDRVWCDMDMSTAPGFDVLERLRGPNNEYLNYIARESSASIEIGGKGAVPGYTRENLHLAITAPNPKAGARARALCLSLIQAIQPIFNQYRATYFPQTHYPNNRNGPRSGRGRGRDHSHPSSGHEHHRNLQNRHALGFHHPEHFPEGAPASMTVYGTPLGQLPFSGPHTSFSQGAFPYPSPENGIPYAAQGPHSFHKDGMNHFPHAPSVLKEATPPNSFYSRSSVMTEYPFRTSNSGPPPPPPPPSPPQPSVPPTSASQYGSGAPPPLPQYSSDPALAQPFPYPSTPPPGPPPRPPPVAPQAPAYLVPPASQSAPAPPTSFSYLPGMSDVHQDHEPMRAKIWVDPKMPHSQLRLSVSAHAHAIADIQPPSSESTQLASSVSSSHPPPPPPPSELLDLPPPPPPSPPPPPPPPPPPSD